MVTEFFEGDHQEPIRQGTPTRHNGSGPAQVFVDENRSVLVIPVQLHAAVEDGREDFDRRLFLSIRQAGFFDPLPRQIDGGLSIGRRFANLPALKLVV